MTPEYTFSKLKISLQQWQSASNKDMKNKDKYHYRRTILLLVVEIFTMYQAK
jgi:hypothetical protein